MEGAEVALERGQERAEPEEMEEWGLGNEVGRVVCPRAGVDNGMNKPDHWCCLEPCVEKQSKAYKPGGIEVRLISNVCQGHRQEPLQHVLCHPCLDGSLVESGAHGIY